MVKGEIGVVEGNEWMVVDTLNGCDGGFKIGDGVAWEWAAFEVVVMVG